MGDGPTLSRWTLVLLVLLGTSVGLGLQWSYAVRHGGWNSLLHVGEDGAYRTLAEEQLGPVPLAPGIGHDGQQVFLQARAPFDAGHVTASTDNAVYRHRRILYPLLAGGFGFGSPGGTVAGLVVVSALGLGLLTAGSAAVAHRFGAAHWGVVAGVTNVGALDSVVLLTPDALAFGLAMVAVAVWLGRRHVAAVAAVTAAVLAKEVYLLIAVGIACHGLLTNRRRAALAVLVAPSALLLLWTSVLVAWFPGFSQASGNLSPPFVGIADAVALWAGEGAPALAVVGLASVVAAILVARASRQRLLWCLTLPWVALALLSSDLIWTDNGHRAVAPLITFAVIGVGLWLRHGTAPDRQPLGPVAERVPIRHGV